MTDRRRGPRVLLATGILFGLVNLVLTPLVRPSQVALASAVYVHAGEAVLSGASLYGTTPPGLPGYYFIYPPVVALGFVPYGLLGSVPLAYALQTVVNMATALALAAVLVREIEGRGVALARRDRWLVGGFCLVGIHSAPTLLNGQLNLQLGLLVAVGLVAEERHREVAAGTALALAALVKLFPALLGAWLVRRRRWRAVAAATATGLGLLAVGVLALGVDPLVTYLTTTVPGQMQTGRIATDPTSVNFTTARRQVAALFPWLAARWLPWVTLAVVAPLVLATYHRVDHPTRRLVAVHATLIGTLLWLPLEPMYFPLAYFPFVVLLYVLPRGRTRRLYLAGGALTLALVSPWTVDAALSAVALSAGLEAFVREAAMGAMAVMQPPTLGMWLLLGGAVFYQWREAPTEPGADVPR